MVPRFYFEIESKTSYTLEELVDIQLHDKSILFRQRFYRWYMESRTERRMGRSVSQPEIDAAIASERTARYSESSINHVKDVIESSAEQYERLSMFPLKLKKALRIIVGRRTYTDNLPIFKKFLLHRVQNQSTKEMAIDEAEAMKQVQTLISIFNTHGLNQQALDRLCEEFQHWTNEHRIKPQRTNAINSRWLKDRRKKLLVLLNHRINALSKGESKAKVKVRIKKMSHSYPQKMEK